MNGNSALGNNGRVEDERVIDSSEGEQDLTAILAHDTSTSEVEIALMAITPKEETMDPLVVPKLHPLQKKNDTFGRPAKVEDVGLLSVGTSSLAEAVTEMSHHLKDFLMTV